MSKAFIHILFYLLTLLCINSCLPDTSESDKKNNQEQRTITISGKVHNNGQGVAGVVVTDGTHLTTTDSLGTYTLESTQTASHIYISTPSGYTINRKKGIPQYYKSVHDINNPEDVNFELIKLSVSDHTHYCIAVGDPQVMNNKELRKMDPILDGMKSHISDQNMHPVHLMVAGDVVFDVPELHNPIKARFAELEQPVYYAIGNHDHIRNKEQPASDEYDQSASDVYKSYYGPTYYSFNKGEIHYVVLDNILYQGGPNTDYTNYITEEQLKWLEKDLSYVPKDKVLFVMVHAPTKTRYKKSYGNSNKLHRLLSQYKEAHIISAHTHYNSVMSDDSGITEHTVGTICGGWWEGPVCLCGTYIGYKVFAINGTSVRWKYRAHEHPEKQFSVHKPAKRDTPLRPSEELLVNVWDWDPNWTVSWSEDNGATFKKMNHPEERTYDPVAFKYYGATDDPNFPERRSWIGASPTDHIFTCLPAEETTEVIIKVTNRFGEEFTEHVNL